MQKLVWQNTNSDVIDLTSGNYAITEWEGFANTTLNVQSQQVPFQDGGVFLDALIEQRELSVTLAMNDNGNLEERYRMRRELTHILNPKLGEGYLIYTNDFISKRIKCIPQIPLFETHNSNTSGTPKASLAWTACVPYWEDLEETVVMLDKSVRKRIENEGDIPCQIKIDLTLSNTYNPEIKLVSKNEKIKLNGLFNSNIFIDTNFGEKKVIGEKLNFDKLVSTETRLTQIYYDKTNTTFYAVGESGRIAYNKDGKNWINKTSSSGKTFRDIAYSNKLNLYVAPVARTTGYNAYVEISENAIDWFEQEIPIQMQPQSVIYSEDLEIFVGCGIYTGGIVFTSVDGINWNYQLLNLNYDILYSITYSERLGLFVIVGVGVILTSTDGTNWTQQTNTDTYNLVKVRYFEEKRLFIATGSAGTILTSADGITWTMSESLVDFVINDVCYSENLDMFVAVGQGKYYLYSSDGIIWQKTELLESGNYSTSICYSSYYGMFIVLDKGFNISSDGITWERQKDSIDVLNFSDKYITYIDELKMYIMLCGAKIVRSSDGLNWTNCNTPSVFELKQLIFIKELGKLFAVGYSSILSSTDGINWTKTDLTSGYYYSIAYSSKSNYFVISGSSGTYKSTDGENWTKVANNIFFCILYNNENDTFIAGEYDQKLYSSSDGETWELNYSNTTNHYTIYSLSYSKSARKFIAVGGDTQGVGETHGAGIILISDDGINWGRLDFYVDKCILFVDYVDYYGFFIATGERGLLLTSIDGKTWTSRNNSILWDSFQSVAFSKDLNLFLMAGYNKLLVSSYLTMLENEISKITKDSNMNLNLDLGNNDIMATCTSGNINARITYRQKYIGV